MIDNERWIRITVHGAPHFAWVEVKANSVQLARALPQAPYGRENAIKVRQNRRRQMPPSSRCRFAGPPELRHPAAASKKGG
jgi:hypothetical protein